MKPVSCLAMILLLAALLPIAQAQALPAELAGYLEPDMNLSTQPLPGSSPAAQLIILNGNESFVVQAGRLLTDPAAIQPLLEQDIVQRAGFPGALNATQSALDDLQSVRAVPEANCARQMAVDHFPCFDKESCVKTSKASPLSESFINAEGFWQAMVGWQASRLNFNDSLNALNAALQSPAPTAAYARSAQANLTAVQTQFDSFMSNDLYRTRYDADCTKYNRSTCFEFCPRTNWTGESSWSALAAQWGQMASSLDSLASQPARAQSLAASASAWMNYTQNRSALWSAMSNELEQRRISLALRFTASASSWSDPSLASNIMSWKQSLNDTAALASSGRIRSALARQSDLDAQADRLLATLNDHDARMAHINNSFASIRLGLASLAKSGSNQSAALSASFAALSASAQAPIPSDQLPELENRSAQLEQLVLSEVARVALGAPPSSQNVSAQAQAIVSPNAAGSNASNSSSPNASASPSKSNPYGLPCALPIGLAAGVLLLAIVRPKVRPPPSGPAGE